MASQPLTFGPSYKIRKNFSNSLNVVDVDNNFVAGSYWSQEACVGNKFKHLINYVLTYSLFPSFLYIKLRKFML